MLEKKFKGIIFDLDDTLILEKDYIKSGFDIISEYFSKENHIENDLVRKIMDELFEENPKYIFNRLFEKFKIQYTEEKIKEYIKLYREHFPNIKLSKETEKILKKLRKDGYKLGIITDGYKETQRQKIKALKLERLIDEIIITDELGRENWKPSLLPYKLMKERLDIEYSEMVYIGDNLEKDFVGANKLGIYTVQIIQENIIYKNININLISKKYLPKIIIKRLYEIIEELI